MPTAPYNPRRRDEEDDADVPMPDGVDEIEVDVGEPAAPAPRTVLQRPQTPDAFGPAGIPDGPNLQTRRAVTKAVTGQRMEPRDYRNIAQRQGIEAFTPATGQQGMDAPDLQVRSAAIKAQLGAPMSNREIDRLNTRQTIETQQGNLPLERSVSTLLAGSRLDPRGTRAEQAAEARRKAAEDKQAARAAEIQARRQFNSDAMAKYKAEGARYYTDPASGRLTPVVDEKGRQLYYRSDWEPGADPQGRPAKVMRDEFGQRQFKRPPVVMSPDAKDEYLYADMGDGESKPYMTLDEAAASEDFSLKRTALSALARRNTALRRERVAPVKQAYDAANAEYEAAKGTLAAMEMEVSREQERIGQIDQAALKETEGGFLGIGAKPTAKAAQAQQAEAQGRARVQQIEGERARLEEAVGPRGTLTLARTIAQADLRLAAAEAARDAYVDQESQIMARLEFARRDPATDPTFQANRAALEAATKAVDGAKASRTRFEEVLRGTPPVTEAKPAAQPQGPSTLGGIVNVAERAGRQSMAAMNVLGASNRARKRDEYLSQAEKLEQQAENVATLQPTWSPESHATWAQRARDTAVQLRERARAMDESMGGELKAATEQMQKASLLQAAEGYQQYSDAEKWGAVRAFLSNPIEVATNIAAEGALGSIPALIAGAAGAASGGVPGLAAGTAIGSFATEYAGSLLESFQQAGIDLSDPAALAAAFDDPEIMADAQKRGVARGIPVAVFDALSGGLAGRTVAPAVRSGVRGVLKAGAREVGEQALIDTGGELSGQVSEQLAMTGEVSDISLKDVAAEVIGGAVPSGAQIAMGAATRLGQQPAAALPPPEDTGRPSTDVPPPTPRPITAADAVPAQPTPDEANARLQAEAANDPELAALLAESEPVATAPVEAPAGEPAPAAEVAPAAVEPAAAPVADETAQVPEPAAAPEPATPVAEAEPAVVAASQAEEPLPSKVRIAGAEFDAVRRNPDGTITVRNAEGGEFDTAPGEQWEPVTEEAPQAPRTIDFTRTTREQFVSDELGGKERTRKIALMEAENAIRKGWKPTKPLPVGVNKLTAFLAKDRHTGEERKLLVRYQIAKRNLESDTRADADVAGRVYDRLKASSTPTPSPEPPVATTEITPEAEGAGAPAQQVPTAAEIAALSPEEFGARYRSREEGAPGLTEEAISLGRATVTEEGVAELASLRDQAREDFAMLRNAGDIQGATDAAAKSQFFSEALQEATKQREAAPIAPVASAAAAPAPAAPAEFNPETPVTIEARRAKTGEMVKMEMPAAKAEQMLNNRVTVLRTLSDCLKK